MKSDLCSEKVSLLLEILRFFYRTNAQSRVFEEVFMRSALPYKVVGGLRFYERREVKDLLAYLRVLANLEDEISLRRIINVPKRGIGDTSLDYVDLFARDNNISFWQGLLRCQEATSVPARAAQAINEFTSMISALSVLVEAKTKPSVIVEAALETIRFVKRIGRQHRPTR
jgi:DNA helicase II / ATP-dependent DNA helicase PcrA